MANPGILRFTNTTFKIALTFCLLLMSGCSWYSKPAYWGRVVDAETGEPLRDVFISISYSISVPRLLDHRATKSVTEINLFTGRDGRFETPPIRTLIGPLSKDGSVFFTVSKQGYASFGPTNFGDCMSTGCNEKSISYVGDLSKKIFFCSHLIRLPKI